MKSTLEMIKVMQAYEEGKPIEFRCVNDQRIRWIKTSVPYWDWSSNDYRVAEIKDSINWSHVSSEFKYMARDENDDVWLYLAKPVCKEGRWKPENIMRSCCVRIVSHSSYTKGTVDWKDSLVERS